MKSWIYVGELFLIAKPKISNNSIINDRDAEMSKNIMDQFVVQADTAQE